MNQGWKSFLQLCVKSSDTALLGKVFDLLFTYEEKEAMSGRLLIIEELMSGKKTQREIAKDLQISIAKITRGSNALKGVDQDVKDFLQQCFEEQN